MLKKIRFTGEYLVYFLKHNYLVLIFGIFLGIGSYLQKDFLLKTYLAITARPKVIGIVGLYTTKNLPEEITSLISYGLTTVNYNDKPQASPIVEKLEILNNDRDYIFTLKNNLYWHNQKKVSAKDFDLHIPGTRVEIKNSQVIKISLSENYSAILSLLNNPLFLNKTLIGMGDYQVTNIEYQEGYIKKIFLKSEKDDKKISYNFYSNERDLTSAFKLGQVDEIHTNILPKDLEQWPNIKITPQIATDRYTAVFLNTSRLSSKQIRQALAYATPKTGDKNERCLGPISPLSWAYNPQVKEYNYNPVRAQELLQKNKIDSLSLFVSDRELLELGDNIKKSWEKDLRIKVNLNTNNQQINLDEYDAILTFGTIPHDPDQYIFWHSTQSNTNLSNLNNSRIDKLLEDGRQTYDVQERKNIYYDFQKFLLEESPAIFIKFPTVYSVSRIE